MTNKNFEIFVAYVWPRVDFSCNKEVGDSSGISTMWDPNKVTFRELFPNPYFHTIEFDDKVCGCLMLTFYVSNTIARRLHIWEKASMTIGSLHISNIIYICDLNIPLYPYEKLGLLQEHP